MRNYLVQIDSLNRQNRQLSDELSATKSSLAAATDRNEELTARNKDLSSKVATGSVVKARAISVKAYNASDKQTDRSSRVKRLEVGLTLVENDLAKKQAMWVYLRVKDPDGNLLIDADRHSFKINGEAVAATAAREVDYEGKELDMIIYVNGISQYEKGVYSVEVYSDAGKLGESEIMLR